uniref:S1 motif domain-containing protein n=1 Tax=viral metagenome TaxID=1070528 RepID=A0A6C0K2U9_9ZZZZ
MESTVFFEKKLSLTPKNINKIGKTATIPDILTEKLRESLENKCSEHGFVLPGSLKLVSRSMGHFENGRFTGDAVYHVKAEGRVILPADGIRVVGTVLRKNRLGLYVTYRNALRIQVPRDLHLGNEEFEAVEIGDAVEVELKMSLFQINDEFILTNGLFLGKREAADADVPVLADEGKEEADEGEGKEEEETKKEETKKEETKKEEEEEEGGEEEEEEEEEVESTEKKNTTKAP